MPRKRRVQAAGRGTTGDPHAWVGDSKDSRAEWWCSEETPQLQWELHSWQSGKGSSPGTQDVNPDIKLQLHLLA